MFNGRRACGRLVAAGDSAVRRTRIARHRVNDSRPGRGHCVARRSIARSRGQGPVLRSLWRKTVRTGAGVHWPTAGTASWTVSSTSSAFVSVRMKTARSAVDVDAASRPLSVRLRITCWIERDRRRRSEARGRATAPGASVEAPPRAATSERIPGRFGSSRRWSRTPRLFASSFRTPSITSAARLSSATMLWKISRTSPRSGGLSVRRRAPASAFARMAASGWRSSCDIVAESSPTRASRPM